MNHFVAKPSDLWLRTVEAIRELAVRERDVERAYAEAMHENARDAWIASRGVRESTGHACIQRLLGKRQCADTVNPWSTRAGPCRPPGTDHPSLWLKDGKPAVYVSQPYGLGGDALASMTAFATEHGLHLSIDTWPAWHFPTAVLQVEWWADWAWKERVGYGHAF